MDNSFHFFFECLKIFIIRKNKIILDKATESQMIPSQGLGLGMGWSNTFVDKYLEALELHRARTPTLPEGAWGLSLRRPSAGNWISTKKWERHSPLPLVEMLWGEKVCPSCRMKENHPLLVIILVNHISKVTPLCTDSRRQAHSSFLPQGNFFGPYLEEGICFLDFKF